MEHRRAWIYCRVAYPDAHALAAQPANLEAYAEKQGFEIVGTTVEQASTEILMALMKESSISLDRVR